MNLKEKLKNNQPVFGGWTLTGEPAITEIMSDEGFDFIGIDMEHAPTDMNGLHHTLLSAKGTGCELLVRLPSCDAPLAKKALDMGASGIIVPSVNTPAEAAQSVAMAKFPPEGHRGASLCRATHYGRQFPEYYASHNHNVVVIVMLEHIQAVEQADAILSIPGIDAVMIGPYDLSASMNLPGQLDHPEVRHAQQRILEACLRHGVAPGIHVVPINANEVARRVEQGFRFIACGLDTLFIREGCRTMLKEVKAA